MLDGAGLAFSFCAVQDPRLGSVRGAGSLSTLIESRYAFTGMPRGYPDLDIPSQACPEAILI